MRAARPFRQLLHDHGGAFGRLRERCEQLKQLDRLVRKHLPEALREHCRVANLRDGELVLQTESPAWSAMLRYQLPSLLKRLQAVDGIPPLHHIRLTVMPASGAVQLRRQQPVMPLRMAPATALLIATLAESLEDAALRASLLRLARHGRDDSS
ncbi:MAG: DUF721 domain-containing protein [Gammaproteobacteria bacterium]